MTADELLGALLETASRHPWPAAALVFATVGALALVTRGRAS
jgi:hypothetical protein